MAKIVLITGSSGYIGSHFVKYFARAGYEVVGLDWLPPPLALRAYLKAWVESDISDVPMVKDLIQKYQVLSTVHCAAKCLVAESVAKPDLYQDNNVRKAGVFVDAASEAGTQHVLFSSTAAVYGEPERVPIPEGHPKRPINPYGSSKLAFEASLQDRAKRGEITVGICRYFNAAGADLDTEIGEVHDPESHLVPNAIKAALKGSSVDVFGNDYSTRDGSCERDYIHVWDLADAHLRLLEQMIQSGQGGIYNLGTGRGFTVKEVLDEVERQVGSPLRRESKPRRPGDPAVLVADPSRANKDLKWSPRHSDLKTIISTALAWHRKS